MFQRSLALLLLAACHGNVRADETKPKVPVDSRGDAVLDACPAAQLVTYYQPDTLPSGPDTRCELENGKCKKLELRGFLYVPPANAPRKAPHPIIVFNHGSGPRPGPACDLGTYFAARGFLVFVPHRRGVGRSTGVAPEDYYQHYCSQKGSPGACKMEYLHVQVQDVEAGADFARKQPDVDPKRLVIMGHSFGGIITVMANTHDFGQRAAVDFAGASQSWEGNPAAVAEMQKGVEQGVTPLFLIEPLNDHSIKPTIELARVAGRACKQVQSLLYAAVDVNRDGKIDQADYDPVHSRDQAHGRGMRETGAWGPAVEEFMDRFNEHPAAPFDKLCQGTSLILEN